MKDTNSLPHWDMSGVYSGLESQEYKSDIEKLVEDNKKLEKYFDENHIMGGKSPAVDEKAVKIFETAIHRLNDIMKRGETLRAYIHSFVATNSRNELAQSEMSKFQQFASKMNLLFTRLSAWIGSLNEEELKAKSDIAQDYSFLIHKAKIEAEHLMPHDLEELASKLTLTGSSAWARLYASYSSQLSVPFAIDDEPKELPISAIRNFAYNPDREIRRRAYEAELDAWENAAVPIAAALNGIKGEQNTLFVKRGWKSPFEKALFDNNIGRDTFEAMMESARESFPDFRRYLRAKANALKLEKLAWFDIFAPIDTERKEWKFSESAAFIKKQFGTFSDKLRGLAERAFAENWIDAEPRPGKRDGAFCMKLRGEESRILSNYKPSFGGLSTLAHELGHAYHNVNLAKRPPLQKRTPMTLAETASIFCETLVRETAIEIAKEHEKLMILEASLVNACQVVVDISSRFLFEQNVYEKRLERELSSAELCDIMVDAQKQTYGDGLDENYLHPYMWAVKPHYYGPVYYNFPYMFGLLFGLGLYSQYLEDPEKFKAMYDDLLSSTGMAQASELAKRFDIDITTPDFWRSSLDIIREDIDKFESIIEHETGKE